MQQMYVEHLRALYVAIYLPSSPLNWGSFNKKLATSKVTQACKSLKWQYHPCIGILSQK